MQKKITLALVGAGERGQYCYAPYAQLHGYEVQFTAVADPDDGRRDKFVSDYHLPANGIFHTAEEFFSHPRMADAVIIATQDNQHYEYACRAIELGYSILLEKPISPSVRECLELQKRAEEKGTTIMVCHVMRYTKFFQKIKDLLDSKVIGDLVHVTHTENVGYWHYAHSYVRGNWHRMEDSSPMILAKCCHDMDILSWLLGSRCMTVSSFGGLRYFNEENAPAGSPDRCTDGCPHSSTCPYYAPKLYLSDETTWKTAFNALSGQFGITPQYISNIFKKYHNENIKDYIAKRKLSHAKELLAQTDLPIREIAVRLGYANEISIIRLFRKYEGVTPGDYRTAHRTQG